MQRRKLFKNKLVALALIFIGLVPIMIERDGTLLIITLLFGLPLFFAKKDWIM